MRRGLVGLAEDLATIRINICWFQLKEAFTIATERLFYHDSYLREFEAKVISAHQRPDGQWAVILDKTAFYPESGGQPFDLGVINGLAVSGVFEDSDDIIHVLPERPETVKVRASVDWLRRFDHMQQHSGEHLLSAIFHDLFGTPNIGFHLGADSSQIDLDITALTAEDINKVESLANAAVFKNLPVRCRFVGENSLKEFKLRKPPSKSFASLRLVEIEGLDCCPCGGTHVVRTGEIGLIKIRSWEKKKSGIRVDFVCGVRALRDYQQKYASVTQLATRLSIPAADVVSAVEKQLERLEAANKLLTAARQELNSHLAAALCREASQAGGVKIIVHTLQGATPVELADLGSRITGGEAAVALLGATSPDGGKAYLLFAASANLQIDMSKYLKLALPAIGGKGGGNRHAAQGGGPLVDKLPEALELARQNLMSELC